MAEAVVEGKKIDAKIQQRDQELRAAQADRSEKDAQRRQSYIFLSLKIDVLRLEIKLKKEEWRRKSEEKKLENKLFSFSSNWPPLKW